MRRLFVFLPLLIALTLVLGACPAAVPAPGGAATPEAATATPEVAGTQEMTGTAEMTSTQEMTGTAEMTSTQEMTGTAEMTGTQEMTGTAEMTGTQEMTGTEEMTGTTGGATQAGTGQVPQGTDAKIASALSAGPASITDKAALLDWPATAGGELIELRAGTNGWTCLPDLPSSPAADPRCFDKPWMEFQRAALEKRAPIITDIGISYMLQGDSAADNDNPAATQPPAGMEWMRNGPHVMVVAPDPQYLAGFSKDPNGGGPWIMWGGTPREHLMVLVEIVASQPVTDKIANALSAGPPSITDKAAVMDWPATAGGELVELRAGTNGWTCLTDDPTSPTDDPMCLDKPWMVWLKAYMTGTKPEITEVGIAYMLQGGSVADNDDPAATQPPAGKAWQIDPPHVMVVAPDPKELAGFSKDSQVGGPWIMWGGTPYEHLMVPAGLPSQ